MKSGLDTMPLFLLDDLLSHCVLQQILDTDRMQNVNCEFQIFIFLQKFIVCPLGWIKHKSILNSIELNMCGSSMWMKLSWSGSLKYFLVKKFQKSAVVVCARWQFFWWYICKYGLWQNFHEIQLFNASLKYLLKYFLVFCFSKICRFGMCHVPFFLISNMGLWQNLDDCHNFCCL